MAEEYLPLSPLVHLLFICGFNFLLWPRNSTGGAHRSGWLLDGMEVTRIAAIAGNATSSHRLATSTMNL